MFGGPQRPPSYCLFECRVSGFVCFVLISRLQITISPDDPAIYGYQGVSYDYYQLFLAWGIDISGLKVLSQNGIKYSALSESAKQTMLKEWQVLWDDWIDFILASKK